MFSSSIHKKNEIPAHNVVQSVLLIAECVAHEYP